MPVGYSLEQPDSYNHTDQHLVLSTDKCLVLPPGHTPGSDGSKKSVPVIHMHILTKCYKSLLELTTTIPTDTHARSCVHGSPSCHPCRRLWGGFIVGEWRGGLLSLEATVAWHGPLLISYFSHFTFFQRRS